MNAPEPKRLQQQVIFYIIYFFCRRGRENLYDMQQDTFTVITNPDGNQMVIQNIDEVEKIMVLMILYRPMKEECTQLEVTNFKHIFHPI